MKTQDFAQILSGPDHHNLSNRPFGLCSSLYLDCSHLHCIHQTNTVLLLIPPSGICVITISSHTGRGGRCNILTCLWVALHQHPQQKNSPGCTHKQVTAYSTSRHIQSVCCSFNMCCVFISAVSLLMEDVVW